MCSAIKTTVHKDAQTELDPVQDPQPVKIAEKRADALRHGHLAIAITRCPWLRAPR